MTIYSMIIILRKKMNNKYADETYLVWSTISNIFSMTRKGKVMKKEMTAEDYLNKVLQSEGTDENCPVRRTLELLSGKWRTHVIYELCKKPSCRFSELKKAVPRITNTMLTATLRDLEELGIIHREQFNEIPPHVEYSLTQKGKELLPVFYEISKWDGTLLCKLL